MNDLRSLIYASILELSTDQGIYASGRKEVYGCIFGRDSAITILKLLRVSSKSRDPKLLEICRGALLYISTLQGKEFNLESGEEPGKFIHEFRPDNYERLLKLDKPWYVYPDGILRNYDSIDSTPLTLIAIFRYWEQTKDSAFLAEVLPAVEKGLNWIITYGDSDKDALLEYRLPNERIHGGLPVQSWTDSHESLLNDQGKMPSYPIAPVEVQGYAWLALKLWADFYADYSPKFSIRLTKQAKQLKENFNKAFLIKDQGFTFAAQALDGDKNQIKTITANPLLCLWASYSSNNLTESVFNEEVVVELVKRAFMSDLFDPLAGIRTMSSSSPTFIPTQNSYHNGSFWPVLNGMVCEGLENWKFSSEADQLRTASLKPIEYFNAPIELYIKREESYEEYLNEKGQSGCRTQAWSAASVLDWLTP
jgi:glycogen debranching enzyme